MKSQWEENLSQASNAVMTPKGIMRCKASSQCVERLSEYFFGSRLTIHANLNKAVLKSFKSLWDDEDLKFCMTHPDRKINRSNHGKIFPRFVTAKHHWNPAYQRTGILLRTSTTSLAIRTALLICGSVQAARNSSVTIAEMQLRGSSFVKIINGLGPPKINMATGSPYGWNDGAWARD
ncbi:hypothetical protein PR048_010415 [Dryococelus australis]|uniref:Uncharacterized protein n=1 Tax=Dryococelus australis TaxID=614101 RepID=A0ABQ9I2Q1_9NEOP|nr:hypothetical protein PR048_010415 [Dryococelus australis]